MKKLACGLSLFSCVLLSFLAGLPEIAAQNLYLSDPLAAGFQTPPDSAKLWAYWWWLNGNVTEESITKDLAGMKEKGFGGAILFDADGSNQDGNIRVPSGPMFGTEPWRKLYRHALKEADSLGLSLSLNIQSGWNFGAPFIKPEHAAKLVTFSETTVSGPGHVDMALPQPKTVNHFYRDVTVLAIPERKKPVGTLRVTASADSSQQMYPASFAVDGNFETFWVSEGNNPEKPVSNESPQHFTLTFAKRVTADTILLHGRPGYGPKDCELAVLSDDGQTWKKLAELSCPPNGEQKKSFARTEGTQFRLTIFSAYDPNHPNAPRNAQIAEIALSDGKNILGTPLRQSVRLKDYNIKIADREAGFSVPDCLPMMLDEPSVPGEEDADVSDVLVMDGKMDADGKLSWDVPEGDWTVIRFGYTQSGSHVSTASGDWQGYTLDYLDPEAFRMYWQTAVQPLINDAGPLAGKVLRYLHTDSWEAGGMNWSADFIREFQLRRGYDPVPYLPIVAGKILGNREMSNRFLNDYRRTIADCIRDNHYALMQTMAAKYGIGIHPESGGPHGGPFDSLQLLGLSDIPMSEYWSWSPRHRVGDVNRFFLKQPATAAHGYGRRIVAAEGFTNIGMHWQESFSDNLKPSFDQALCEGMNLLVWHAFTCSPKEMGLPGQEYFAGTHFNPNNFTFSKSQDFLKYINRSQFLLQQGLFAADVLEYYGENSPNFTQMKWGNTAKSLPGYDYDTATEEILLKRVTVKESRIILPDGTSYKILLLPNRNSISAAVLRKLERWVIEGGLTVIGPKPRRITGLTTDHPGADAEVQKIAAILWGTENEDTANSPVIRTVGKGRVVTGMTSHELLKKDNVPFDFERIAGTNAKPRVDSIHRLLYKNQAREINLKPFAEFSAKDVNVIPADAESGLDSHIYFVANLSADPDHMQCAFRVTGLQPELWDPLTGEMRTAKAFRQESERTVVPLDLTGYGSVFVVFRKPIPVIQQGTTENNSPKMDRRFLIDGGWDVTFDEKWGGPKNVFFETLIPWNQSETDAVRYYSGAAVYRKAVRIPEDFVADKTAYRYVLQLGNVSEIAEVWLNGRPLGTVWARPYQVDVTDAVRAGENMLEIAVVNHWANRIIGDASLPEPERRTQTNIRKLTPQTPLMDSGLTGPVMILRLQD
ncbi:MAG: discoidin domain-containing protein [Planctomycetaceae bacterium]|nr:discoidin domain-containing protein [Planctomycetaceae bacterium]